MVVGLALRGQVIDELGAGGRAFLCGLLAAHRGGDAVLAGDVAAHDVERVVHAEHDAVVAGLGHAGHDLRAELGQQVRQAGALREREGGVAGRERAGVVQSVILVVGRFAVSPVEVLVTGDLLDVQRLLQTVHVQRRAVEVHAVHVGARVLVCGLGDAGGSGLVHVRQELGGLRQLTSVGGVLVVLAEHRTERVVQRVGGVHLGVGQGALVLRGVAVGAVRLVVDVFGELVVVHEHRLALIGHALACDVVLVEVGQQSGDRVLGGCGLHHGRRLGAEGDGGDGAAVFAQRHLGAESLGEVDALESVGAGVQRVAGVNFGGFEHLTTLGVGQVGECGEQQVLRALRHDGRLTGGRGLRESVGHACGVGVDGGRAVGHRFGGHRVGEGVLVSVLVVGAGLARTRGDGVAVAVGLAACGDVVLKFVMGRQQHVLAERGIRPQSGDGCAGGDASADHVHRVVHAEHDAVVAAFGGAGHEFRSELGQQRGQSQTAVVGLGGVAGREGLRRLLIIGVILAVFLAVDIDHRDALDVERRAQTVEVGVTADRAVDAFVLLVEVRTRVVEVLLGAAGADEARERVLAAFAEHQVGGLGQLALRDALGHVLADDRPERVLVDAQCVAVARVESGALGLRVGAVDLGGVGGGLVVDGHDGLVVLSEHALAGIGDLAAEGIALRRVVHDLLRGPPVVILAEQRGDVRLDRAAVRGSVRGVRGDAHGHQHRDGCDACHGALEDRGLTHCLVHSFSFHCVLVDMEPILL